MQPFNPYDFTNNRERLLLESMFSSWLFHEYDDGLNQDTEQWYRDFHAGDLDSDSEWPRLFKAFAAGVSYGQDLALGLSRLSDPDMEKWQDDVYIAPEEE